MEATDVTEYLAQLDRKIELDIAKAAGALAVAVDATSNLNGSLYAGYQTYKSAFEQMKAVVEQMSEPEAEAEKPSGVYL